MMEYQSLNAALAKQVLQLLAQNANLEAELKLRNKHTYSTKSQKVKKDKDTEPPKSREEEKGDFDGTPGSIDSNSEVNEKDENTSDSKSETTQNEIRDYRKGLIYETMKAASKLIHIAYMVVIYCYEKDSRSRDAFSYWETGKSKPCNQMGIIICIRTIT